MRATRQRNYLVDWLKLLFACFIPFLHIRFETDNYIIVFIQQYISRLGVPVFFMFSGMYLAEAGVKKGNQKALKKYLRRVGMLLAIWLIIYSPALIYGYRDDTIIGALQKLICLTPMYLWYLVASFVAAIPFCLIRNRKLLWGISAGLYTLGTITGGGGYYWLVGGWPSYEKVFLTTRNGVFFALPMFCIGEFLLRKKKRSVPMMLLTIGLLWMEISVAVWHQSPGDMYLLLPIACYWIGRNVLCSGEKGRVNWGPPPRLSTGIYLMQFGIITVFTFVLRRLQLYPNRNLGGAIVYMGVVGGGTLVYFICRKLKIDRVLL